MCSVEGKRRVHNLQGLAASFVIVYPLYNIIKRVLKSAESFASSSFSNNCSEWALGFSLGITGGLLCSLIAVAKHSIKAVDPSVTLSWIETTAMTSKLVCGSLLFCSSVLSAVMFGSSWDNTAARTDIEDPEDTLFTILFLAIPIGLTSAILFFYFRSISNDGPEEATEMGNRVRGSAQHSELVVTVHQRASESFAAPEPQAGHAPQGRHLFPVYTI